MKTTATSPELLWAEKERVYRADKKAVNRQMHKSFALILFLIVLAVSVASVLANVRR